MDIAESKEQQPHSEHGSFHHDHHRSGQINAAGSRQKQPNRHGSYCENHHRQHSGGRRLLSAFVDKKPSSFFRGEEPQIVLANQSAYRVSYWVAEEDKTRTRAHRESIVASIGLQLNNAVGNNNRRAAAVVSGLSRNSVSRPTEESVDTVGNNNNSNTCATTAIISRAPEKANKSTPAKTLKSDNNNNSTSAAVRSLLSRGGQKPTEGTLNMGEVGGGGVERTTAPAETTIDMESSEVYFLTRDHRMGPAGQTQATKIAFPIDCRDLRVYAFFELDGLWRLYTDKVYSIGRFKKVFKLTSSDDNIKPHLG